MAGYPWGADIHLAIYVIGIGTGAGVGAYVGWINLGLRWYVVAITVVLVIAAGVLGSALANAYDDIMLRIFPFLDTYMSERDERVNVTHFGASLAAILVSTVLGLFYHFRTRS